MASAFDSFNSTGFDGFIHSGFDARGGGRATLWKINPSNGSVVWSYDQGNWWSSLPNISPAQDEYLYSTQLGNNCIVVERGVSIVKGLGNPAKYFVVVHKATSLTAHSCDIVGADDGVLVANIAMTGNPVRAYASDAISSLDNGVVSLFTIGTNPIVCGSFVAPVGGYQQYPATNPPLFYSTVGSQAFCPLSTFPDGTFVLAGYRTGEGYKLRNARPDNGTYTTPVNTEFVHIALSPLRSYEQTTMWILTQSANGYSYRPVTSGFSIGAPVFAGVSQHPQSGKNGNGYYAEKISDEPPLMQVTKIGGWSALINWSNRATCPWRNGFSDTSIVEGVDGVFVGGAAPESVTKLNPETGEVVWTIDLRSDPSEPFLQEGRRFVHALCIGPDGYLYAGGHRQ